MTHFRIAHVSATFPPYQGGTGNVCFHNAHELAKRGHKVHVFTAGTTGAPEQEMLDGVTVHRLKPLFRIGNAPALPGLLPALRNFDIIHLHYPFILGAELVRLASVMYRKPVVISFHNDLIGDGARAWIFAIYQHLSALIAVRAAACLCAVSHDHYFSSVLYRSLRGWKRRVVELPNGVDTDRFHPSSTSDAIRERLGIPVEVKLVLFVAALDRAHHFKGLGTLLKAMHALPPNVWLLVVGDGDLRHTYEQQAAIEGIAERTIFAGRIAHEDTPPYFRSADVTVLPSSPPESFGLVLIESMSCGTPVIASDIPGVRTVVEHEGDGLLIQQNSPKALAEAVLRLIGNEESCQIMGKHGRVKVADRYSWPSIGQRLEAIYEQVSAQAALSGRVCV